MTAIALFDPCQISLVACSHATAIIHVRAESAHRLFNTKNAPCQYAQQEAASPVLLPAM